MKSQADADDITQTVFLKLLRSDTAFSSEEHVRNWLMKVTANGKGDYSHDRGGVERANRLLIANIGETKHDNCCTECRSQRYDPLNFGTALFFG